ASDARNARPPQLIARGSILKALTGNGGGFCFCLRKRQIFQ
ncbi:hypothetical protein ACVWWQ_003404, partial [Rhodanobacter sp. TND4EL1]